MILLLGDFVYWIKFHNRVSCNSHAHGNSIRFDNLDIIHLRDAAIKIILFVIFLEFHEKRNFNCFKLAAATIIATTKYLLSPSNFRNFLIVSLNDCTAMKISSQKDELNYSQGKDARIYNSNQQQNYPFWTEICSEKVSNLALELYRTHLLLHFPQPCVS